MVSNWKIVNEKGNDVIKADVVAMFARIDHRTPQYIAEQHARVMNAPGAGNARVFAVKAD